MTQRTIGRDAALIQAKLQSGFALQQQGQVGDAAKLYLEALRLDENNFDALHLLGLLYLHTGKYEWAMEHLSRAVRANPKSSSAYSNLGGALKLLHRLPEAVASYTKAIALKPDYAEAYYNRGSAYQDLNQLTGAINDYNSAINFKPDFVEAYFNLGNALCGLNRFDEAIKSYNRAVECKPDHADAWYNCGVALNKRMRFDDAITCHDKAIALRPDFVEALVSRATALSERKRFEEALSDCNKAIQLKPDYAEAHAQRGSALDGLKHFEEALASFDKAIALKPDLVEAYLNRGLTFENLNRFDDAVASFNKAIEIKPDFVAGFFNKALVELRTANFSEGWKNYEWRKRREAATSNRNYSQPLLQSLSDIDNKTVLVYWEQGLGDTIQFCRYLNLLAERSAKILFAPQKGLNRFLRSLNGKIDFVDADDPSLVFDFQIPLMSLPLLYGTSLETIPGKSPYLFAEPALIDAWKAKLKNSGFKVGICWEGSALNKGDASRSFSVHCFEPLAKVADIRLISLQKAAAEGKRATLPGGMVVETLGDDLDAGPDAFVDTAAVMMNLDLVITCDTAIAHVAGALGVPAWVALSHVADWRWLQGRADSPWYPSLRLFRQKTDGDWKTVFDEIKNALIERKAKT